MILFLPRKVLVDITMKVCLKDYKFKMFIVDRTYFDSFGARDESWQVLCKGKMKAKIIDQMAMSI